MGIFGEVSGILAFWWGGERNIAAFFFGEIQRISDRGGPLF
jgi:nicotinamide riboside transporter PnuC